jgi:hypothetical protein
VIQQHQRIGAPQLSASHPTIAIQLNQIPSRFGVKETDSDHATCGVAAELIRKAFLRVFPSPGYIPLLQINNAPEVVIYR